MRRITLCCGALKKTSSIKTYCCTNNNGGNSPTNFQQQDSYYYGTTSIVGIRFEYLPCDTISSTTKGGEIVHQKLVVNVVTK